MKERIVFVYNADSGFVNTVIDHLHKTLSPESYRCRLCLLTFEGFTMAPAWKEFLASLGTEVEFHHRDTFTRAYGPLRERAPVVFRLSGGVLRPLVRAEELEGIRTLAGLIATLRTRV